MMKKISLLFAALLACHLNVSAQDFVTDEPQKRNVLVEEFTGRNCQFCPNGHAIANSIMESNPGRAFVVAINSGGLSPKLYPNLNTSEGDSFDAGFEGTSRPSAVINRSSAEEKSRTAWAAEAVLQMDQDAEVNVGGIVVIDKATRTANIIVEAYYTDDSQVPENYLNVIMLQDSILGHQEGSEGNPDQIINGQYNHMHVFRSAVTPTWGEAVSPTTANSFIRKTYTYQIPATIGEPYGVSVNIDDISFLAFITEQYQGIPTRPILNVNKLIKVEAELGSVSPAIIEAKQMTKISCSNENSFYAKILNVGTTTLESMTINLKIDGEVVDEYQWEGSLEQYKLQSIDFNLEVPEGEHTLTYEIVNANGTSVNQSKTIDIVSKPWVEFTTDKDEMPLIIDVRQDKYGEQITWEIIKSDMTVVASGGPYELLSGSTATKLHRVNVNVPSDECLRFIIRDSGGNGICCQYGSGYYKIKTDGAVLIDGSGEFGSEAFHDISIVKTTDVEEFNSKETYKIFPNPTKNVINIEGENMSQIMMYNSLGQMVKSIECDNNNMTIDTSDLENGVYIVNIINNDGVVSTNRISVIK